MGVMLGTFDQSVRVPGDLLVISFDNIRLAEFSIPPLTTVEMPQAELARIAFRVVAGKDRSSLGVKCAPRIGAHYESRTQAFYGPYRRRERLTGRPRTTGHQFGLNFHLD